MIIPVVVGNLTGLPWPQSPAPVSPNPAENASAESPAPSANVLKQAAEAVGVPIPLVRKVWAHRKIAIIDLDDSPVSDRADLPTTPAALMAEAPRPSAMPVALRSHLERRKAIKEPEPGKRICSGCKKLLPRSDFDVKDKRTGQLRASCRGCFKQYQQKQYLTSKQLAILGPVLEFVLESEDAHVGATCPDCGRQCKAGELVIATHATIRHADHPDTTKGPEPQP